MTTGFLGESHTPRYLVKRFTKLVVLGVSNEEDGYARPTEGPAGVGQQLDGLLVFADITSQRAEKIVAVDSVNRATLGHSGGRLTR